MSLFQLRLSSYVDMQHRNHEIVEDGPREVE